MAVEVGSDAEVIKEFLEKHDMGKPFDVDQVAELFPYMVRKLPTPVAANGSPVVCIPQAGEAYRFGVYFWAFNREPLPEEIENNGSSTIVIPTRELITGTGINPELVERGVVLDPSKYMKHLWDEAYRNSPDSKSISAGMELGRQIAEQNIILDHSVVGTKASRPIVSIPSTVSIPPTKLA